MKDSIRDYMTWIMTNKNSTGKHIKQKHQNKVSLS